MPTAAMAVSVFIPAAVSTPVLLLIPVPVMPTVTDPLAIVRPPVGFSVTAASVVVLFIPARSTHYMVELNGLHAPKHSTKLVSMVHSECTGHILIGITHSSSTERFCSS